MQTDITIRLTGILPMLQHNGRLANPLDAHARSLKALTAKRKKSDQDIIEIALTEARGGIYETEEGLLGLPNECVLSCLYEAAKAFKSGKILKRSLTASSTVSPILLNGKTVTVQDFLSNPENVDIRTVRNQNNRVPRARPRVPAGWQSEHKLQLLSDVMDKRDLVPILIHAGRLIGVGDWRPKFGTFSVEVVAA